MHSISIYIFFWIYAWWKYRKSCKYNTLFYLSQGTFFHSYTLDTFNKITGFHCTLTNQLQKNISLTPSACMSPTPLSLLPSHFLHPFYPQSSNEHLEITGLVEKQYYSFIQNSQILYFLPFQVSLHTISRSSNQTAVKSHLIKFKAKIKQMLAE